MPRTRRPAPANGEPPRGPRVLPGVGHDVVHIQTGRRVVTVELPPRRDGDRIGNLERVFIIARELRRRAIIARAQRTD